MRQAEWLLTAQEIGRLREHYRLFWLHLPQFVAQPEPYGQDLPPGDLTLWMPWDHCAERSGCVVA